MRSVPATWLEMMSVVFVEAGCYFLAAYSNAGMNRKTGILFIDLASDLLLDCLLAAYSNAGMNSEDRNSIYRSRKQPVLVSLLAAYNNAGINSEDGTSIYRSRKRPATCWS